jgi:hypothetical protein
MAEEEIYIQTYDEFLTNNQYLYFKTLNLGEPNMVRGWSHIGGGAAGQIYTDDAVPDRVVKVVSLCPVLSNNRHKYRYVKLIITESINRCPRAI